MVLLHHSTFLYIGKPILPMFWHQALLPVEIGLLSSRLDNFSIEWNDLKIAKNFALLEHLRSNTAIWEYNYKRPLAKHKNSRVRPHTLILGDLVLRKNFISHQEPTQKLDTNWEGPYIITKVNLNGSFRLKDSNKTNLTKTWNAINLQKYYPYIPIVFISFDVLY